MASRDNFKCPKCGERYKENKENLAELKKRCNDIFKILDERFDQKLGGLNKKSHANNMDYLKFMQQICNRYAIDPYLLEFILYNKNFDYQ